MFAMLSEIPWPPGEKCGLGVAAVVDALAMTAGLADRSLSVILSAGLLLLLCPLGRERITRRQYAGINADAQ